MTAPINSINSALSLVRRSPFVQQNQTLEARRTGLVESNQQRREYIGSLENYKVVNRELYTSNNELVQLHKEHRQLLQESKASGEKLITLLQESKAINQQRIDLYRETNAKLLALFDKKPATNVDSTKASRIEAREAVEQSKVTKELKQADTEIKTLNTKSSTLDKQIAVAIKEKVSLSNPVSHMNNVDTKPKIGKVFDYVPKKIAYQPTPAQISANVVSSNNQIKQHSEIAKLPTVSIPMQQMLQYSQKNLWESIMSRVMASKLV